MERRRSYASFRRNMKQEDKESGRRNCPQNPLCTSYLTLSDGQSSQKLSKMCHFSAIMLQKHIDGLKPTKFEKCHFCKNSKFGALQWEKYCRYPVILHICHTPIVSEVIQSKNSHLVYHTFELEGLKNPKIRTFQHFYPNLTKLYFFDWLV